MTAALTTLGSGRARTTKPSSPTAATGGRHGRRMPTAPAEPEDGSEDEGHVAARDRTEVAEPRLEHDRGEIGRGVRGVSDDQCRDEPPGIGPEAGGRRTEPLANGIGRLEDTARSRDDAHRTLRRRDRDDVVAGLGRAEPHRHLDLVVPPQRRPVRAATDDEDRCADGGRATTTGHLRHVETDHGDRRRRRSVPVRVSRTRHGTRFGRDGGADGDDGSLRRQVGDRAGRPHGPVTSRGAEQETEHRASRGHRTQTLMPGRRGAPRGSGGSPAPSDARPPVLPGSAGEARQAADRQGHERRGRHEPDRRDQGPERHDRPGQHHGHEQAEVDPEPGPRPDPAHRLPTGEHDEGRPARPLLALPPRRRRRRRHSVTFGRSCARSLSPMPLTSPSSSTEVKRPCSVRQSMIRCARTGPTPGRESRAATSAELRLTGAPEPDGDPGPRRHHRNPGAQPCRSRAPAPRPASALGSARRR